MREAEAEKWALISAGRLLRRRTVLGQKTVTGHALRDLDALAVCEVGPAALNRNPRHFTERHLVVAAIVKAGGAGALVVGHLLRDFELAAVPQTLRHAGRAEGVATDLCLDAGVGRARRIMRYTSAWTYHDYAGVPAAWNYRGRLLLTVSKPYQNAILSCDGTCL